MVTILCTNNSAVFRQLGSRPFQRLGVKCWVATSGTEVLEMMPKHRPAMALIDVELPDLDGYEVCRRIKADPELRGTRVMLVAGNVIRRDDLTKLGESGCDDVFCVPAPSEELYLHVSRLLGFPYRGSRRIAVHLRVALANGTRMVEGTLLNLSREGAKIGIPERLGGTREVMVRLSRSEREHAAVTKARVIWEREAAEGTGYAIGVHFEEVPPDAQRLIEALSLYDLTRQDDGTLLVTLQGDFNEATDFSELQRQLVEAGKIELDLSNVRYLNSWGVRRWVALVDAIPRAADYSFVRASIAFVTQAGMVPRVLGRGHVLSLMAPYHCEKCDRSDERLLQTSSLSREAQVTPPTFRCGDCGGELVFDDVPERYFAFLTTH